MVNFDADDRRLIGQVRAALDETDPVPEAVVQAADASLTWLTIDAELAALAADTAESALAGSGTRAETTSRMLTFECSTGVIVLEVVASGDDNRRLIGQTDRPARLEIRHPGGTSMEDTDGHGRFRIEDVPAGPISVRCVFHDSPDSPIVTSWVVV